MSQRSFITTESRSCQPARSSLDRGEQQHRLNLIEFHLCCVGNDVIQAQHLDSSRSQHPLGDTNVCAFVCCAMLQPRRKGINTLFRERLPFSDYKKTVKD